jgi:integrase
MATIKYFIRTNTKAKLANIYVRVKQGRFVDMTAKTGNFILPENWIPNSETIKQKADIKDKDGFKDKLKELRRHIEDELLNVKDKNDPGKDWLKITIEKYWNPEKFEQKKVTLFWFIESYIKLSKERVNPASGKKIAVSTLKKYGTCFYHLKQFANKNDRVIDFDDITVRFYYDFTTYLTKDCNLATNTVGKQIAVLKGFMSAASDQNLTTNTEFRKRSFKIVTEESESIYLTEEELEILWVQDFSEKVHLEKVRDYFLIGCWTGCRFQDWELINYRNIKEDFLIYEQGKTGTKVTVPLHPIVKDILDKYRGNLPEKLQNQSFNRSIKDVCRIAEINSIETKSITKGGIRKIDRFEKWEMVSSHTARRSFATNLYKSGFPSISIMAITGHRTERSFLKYIKVTPEEHANLLQEHWLKNRK